MPRNRSLPAGAALTVELLSAYLANNTVAARDIPDLVRSIRMALVGIQGPTSEEIAAATFTRAVSVRKSLSSSAHIVSMINGKPYRTLRRHLAAHGLTPESYRARYNLPADYPMVAPDYAAFRRALAQTSGFRRSGFIEESASEEAAAGAVLPGGDANASSAAARASEQISSAIETAIAGAGVSLAQPAKTKMTSGLATSRSLRTLKQVQQSADSRQTEAKDPRKQDVTVGRTIVSSSGGDLDGRSLPAPTPTVPLGRQKHLAPAPEQGEQDGVVVEGSSPRLTLMEAIARKRAVKVLYNAAVIKLAPHQIFERHGDLFLIALNLSKNWREDEERRLGQFKLAGLRDVELLEEAVTSLPSYNGMLPRADDVQILSI